MFFSRIELNHNGLQVANLLKKLSGDDYRHHQFIWQLFEGVEDRDFLYRREDARHWPRYYAVSAREPVDKEGLWIVETKSHKPNLQQGMQLAFSLRANPVVTRKVAQGKAQRHDVVMDEKKRIGYRDMATNERPSLAHLIQEAGSQWLGKRSSQYGFEIKHVSVDGYQQHQSIKGVKAKPITFSTLDYSGLLSITNVPLFEQAVYKGIGPAKGLGCGLLLVRRI